MESYMVSHPFEPVHDEYSRVLILGTMPSPKSREVGFYYSHPQNRFWKVMSAIFEADVPPSIEGRKRFLLDRRVALWDVLSACEINNADDASIRKPAANDMSRIFRVSPIKAVFTTGKKAQSLYGIHCMGNVNDGGFGLEPRYLPSTSAANQGNYDLEALVREYKVILDYP